MARALDSISNMEFKENLQRTVPLPQSYFENPGINQQQISELLCVDKVQQAVLSINW